MFKFRTRDPINPISLISGEFINRGREESFFMTQLKSQLTNIRITILVLASMFLAFVVPDFLSNSGSFVRLSLLVCRLFVFVLTLTMFFLLKHVKNRRMFVLMLSACEAAVVAVFLYAIASYETPKILLQAFSAILLIIVFNMIMNSFVAIVFLNLTLLVGFAIVTRMFHNAASQLDRIAVIVYLLMTMGLCMVAYSRTERLKRRQSVILEQLESLSVTDALTRCFNRMKFNDELHSEIERSRRYGLPMSLVLYDYDYFKLVNDKYGHPAGDLVLIRTSRLVRQSIRTVDILARWGGEEFMLLLPDTPIGPATDLAGRIKDKIAACDCGPVEQVTCSFGVTELRKDDTMETLLQRVDDLLYIAKQQGRNQVVSG